MEQTEKQSEFKEITVKKNGGVREGAGRPKGSINKISGQAILEAINDTLGIPFEIQFALNYQAALYGDDRYLLNKYDTLVLNKVVSDKIDVTTNGQNIAPVILLDYKEIDESN